MCIFPADITKAVVQPAASILAPGPGAVLSAAAVLRASVPAATEAVRASADDHHPPSAATHPPAAVPGVR